MININKIENINKIINICIGNDQVFSFLCDILINDDDMDIRSIFNLMKKDNDFYYFVKNLYDSYQKHSNKSIQCPECKSFNINQISLEMITTSLEHNQIIDVSFDSDRQEYECQECCNSVFSDDIEFNKWIEIYK